MSRIYNVYLIFLCLSCTEITSEKVNEEVFRQIEERKSNFIAERIIQCNRTMYQDAQSIADSILRIESKQAKMDSIKVPYDTSRPLQPEVQFPEYKKPKRDSLN
ncbi:MAG: hypothetical protein IT267_00435 [Saprospiraceae bacterium]|nr:hypothetical protein [Saprospiraceae bacterium]